MKVAIIGKGQIGREIEKKMKEKAIDEILTVDINPDTKPDYPTIKEFNRKELAKVYIVCVLTQEQLISVVSDIDLSNKPLISIETACNPDSYKKVKNIVKDKANVIVFQERWNPNDMYHDIFNQPRVMGGDIEKGREFYIRYMMYENIIVTDKPELASLCKIVENAYRFVDIAIAEELKLLTGDDFDELRRLMNTKWNIDLPEARDGIGGHCLPKDIKLVNEYFPRNLFFKNAMVIDNLYKEFKKHVKILTEGGFYL